MVMICSVARGRGGAKVKQPFSLVAGLCLTDCIRLFFSVHLQ